jgi:hypothetical protein
MDTCGKCNSDPCTCGGDFSTDAPGAQEAATPAEGTTEGGA